MTQPRLLITMGDAAGIGPEIVAAAFAAGHAGRCVVVGDLGVMRRAAARSASAPFPVTLPSFYEAALVEDVGVARVELDGQIVVPNGEVFPDCTIADAPQRGTRHSPQSR